MLKLIKYELIKQKTSKVIIGAILALLEVAFLAGMLLGKEEIMAIAAGMLTFLASVTFVIVGLEEIITYYHDLRDKSGYMLFMTPYNVYEIMGSKILTGFFSIAAAAIIFGIIGFADITMVCAKYGELQTLFDQMKSLFRFTLQVNVDGMLHYTGCIQLGWNGDIRISGYHIMYYDFFRYALQGVDQFCHLLRVEYCSKRCCCADFELDRHGICKWYDGCFFYI